MERNRENKILVNHTPWWTRIALKEDGVLSHYEIEKFRDGPRHGDIFKGRIVNVVPGLQAAFVNLGRGKFGYLYIDDVLRPIKQGRKIKNLLTEGQELVVQVIREEENDKGPKVSMKISLPGRYLVYLPYDSQVHVSSKISDKEKREALMALVEKLREDIPGAFIIRTAAAFATEEEIVKEAENLSLKWDDILHRSVNSDAPELLYREKRLVERVIRDYVRPDISRVIVDSQEALNVIGEELRVWPSASLSVEFYRGEVSLFKKEGVEEELERIMRREIKLPSGGFIVIDEMEAFTGIDVNTGSHTGEMDFEATAFHVNLEAAREIMRILRIRNISGLIVIDFLNMKKENHQRKILKIIKEESLKDTAKITFKRFSDLGTLEMTRRKTEKSLKREITSPCPFCQGTGHTLSHSYVAMQILDEIAWKLNVKRMEKIKVYVHPEVKDYILETYGRDLADLKKKYGTDILILEGQVKERRTYKLGE